MNIRFASVPLRSLAQHLVRCPRCGLVEWRSLSEGGYDELHCLRCSLELLLTPEFYRGCGFDYDTMRVRIECSVRDHPAALRFLF